MLLRHEIPCREEVLGTGHTRFLVIEQNAKYALRLHRLATRYGSVFFATQRYAVYEFASREE